MAPSSSTMPLARVSAKRPSSVFSTRCACSLPRTDRKSTRLNSSHSQISYAVFCLKKKNPPANLGDALSSALVPTIFALFVTDLFDNVGTGGTVENAATLSDTHRHPAAIRHLPLFR